MHERDGILGLAMAALLAWILPAGVRALDTPSPAAPVIHARPPTDTSSPPALRWVSNSPTPDGWELSADGAPLHPIPGWRGLLLGHPMDLNTATGVDLEALPGVGPHTAARVLAYRRQAGPFSDVGELARVKGIGPATVRRLGSSLRVHQPPGAR